MKKTFNLLMLLALGAGVFTLNSCSEEPTDDPTPAASPTCYMTQSTEDGDITSYTYNSDNDIVVSVYDGDTTKYEYSGGRLSLAYDGYEEATFIYTSGNIPSRVNLKEDGVNSGYIIIESTNSNITKIEEHDADDQIQTVTFTTYDASGNLTTMKVDEWDEETSEFYTLASISNIKTDTKKNPYTTSMALVYANMGSPFIYGQTNMISGDFTLFGQSVPVTGTHTYNGNNYPTASTLDAAGEKTEFTYMYDCK